MELNDLVTKLNIMKKEKPEEFKDFMNRLKIEKPGIYDKIKPIVGFEEESPISFGESPLELKLAEDKERKYTLSIFLIIVVVIIIFLIAVYLFSQ
ncbi:MAG: hypothetical protein JW791_02655 [Nanoarchaeota archaeon]|nr:hypothetical protein [Nanoarchaeota archaeon]